MSGAGVRINGETIFDHGPHRPDSVHQKTARCPMSAGLVLSSPTPPLRLTSCMPGTLMCIDPTPQEPDPPPQVQCNEPRPSPVYQDIFTSSSTSHRSLTEDGLLERLGIDCSAHDPPVRRHTSHLALVLPQIPVFDIVVAQSITAPKHSPIMGILTFLVHNEAMKTDPPEIYGWRVFALACSVN